STREAYTVVMQKINEIKAATVNKVVSELRLKKAKVTSTVKTVDFNVLENTYAFPEGRKFDTSHKYNVTSNVYTVVMPEQSIIDQVQDAITGGSGTTASNQQTAGGGGLLVSLGVGYLLNRIFKIF